VDNSSVLDAALIAAAQAVEHYEMIRYGTLIAWRSSSGTAIAPASFSRISMKKGRRMRS
jgi:ferritin-like metal-binding protein YciE